MEKVIFEYKLFGFTVWSVTRKIDLADEEAVYQRLSQRFADEMKAALDYAKGGR